MTGMNKLLTPKLASAEKLWNTTRYKTAPLLLQMKPGEQSKQ